ncbi:glycosyltransferase family 2 protein [Shewanella vesiculosa]|uniref:glycosyltransferase family 2 protein n=1 Tax=Shewanella vesiculosa TaxID=518738 RepID=UPI003D036F6B
MKVSIITVCYNSERTIEDTLKSISQQTYPNIEHIIIDGNSSDSTNDIVERYADSVAIHVSESDNGLYDAMNKGIKLATGDVIGILNSDDVFASKHSLQDLMLNFDESVDGVYSDLVYVSENDLSKVTRLYSSKIFNKSLIRFGIMLPHPTFYVRKKHYENFGLYKTDYRVSADFELLTRFVSQNLNLMRSDKITIKMREGGISSSGLMWRIHQNFEIVRACKENNIYTNIFMVMLKLPYKLATLVTRYFVKVK